jgi:ComF family protein
LHHSVCVVVWSAAVNDLVRTFLAPACAGCDDVLERPLAGAVCEACWRAVSHITPPLCVVCGDALSAGTPYDAGLLERPDVLVCARCGEHPPRFIMARSAGRYDGPLRNVIHAFKYGRRRPLAAPIARLMIGAGAGVLAGADAVVPVPLHPWRMLRRGFNQADDLAVHLGLPVWRVLRRTRHGPPQASLPASQRGLNAGGAFAFGPMFGLLSPWWAWRLRDRTVVLVDDVMTTGATLDACSAVLLAAGVRSVRALTAARAVATRPVPRPARQLLATAPRR